MHPIRIKHYVEKSFDDKPSFIIEMSDGINYISNGCVFEPVSNIESTGSYTLLTDGSYMYHDCSELK